MILHIWVLLHVVRRRKSSSLQKTCKKAKPNEKIHIYYGFSTSDNQISMRFPTRNIINSDLKTDVANWVDNAFENEPSAPKLALKEVPKSIKNQ